MDKKIFVPILGLVLFLLVPNPVMGQAMNYGYNQPKQTYVESHYGIMTCDSTFQYKFICDRIDVMIQQNDQIISSENAIKSQNTQLISLAKAQVCMTGFASRTNYFDQAANFGVDCNMGKK